MKWWGKKRAIWEIKKSSHYFFHFSFNDFSYAASFVSTHIPHSLVIQRSKWFSPNVKSKLSSEWIFDDSEIKSCKRYQPDVRSMEKAFHLSRLKWKENHEGVMLLTHHLNGCYEYQKMMMLTTDPMFIARTE